MHTWFLLDLLFISFIFSAKSGKTSLPKVLLKANNWKSPINPVISPYDPDFSKTISRLKRQSRSPNEICKYSEFTCLSKQCIKKNLVCNGKLDCGDGSDESITICFDMKCPLYHSACFYGACVHRTKKCNGVVDCKDGSDEDPEYCKTWNTTLRWSLNHNSSIFLPTSGDSLDEDEDDEFYPIEEITENFTSTTPGEEYIDNLTSRTSVSLNETYIFTCLSGQIIHESSLCDGTSDCYDGSDETIAQCIGLRCPGYLFQCAFGACIEMHKKCNGEEDCKDGSDEVDGLCKDMKSSVSHEFCPRIVSDSLEISCFLFENEVNCTLPILPGTLVKARCMPAYHLPDNFDGFSDAICLLGGKWNRHLFKCVPDCGKRIAVKPLLWYSKETSFHEYSWHAGIYKNFGNHYICGASVVSAKAVITAAHCVDDYKEKNDYVVAAGKVWRSWDVKEPYEQKFKVIEFIVQRGFRGSDSLYGEDIAILALDKHIQITPTVMPVCLDRNPPALSYSQLGTVVGWGHTESGDLSGKLRMAKLSVKTAEECLKILQPGFTRFLTRDKFCGGVLGSSNGSQIDAGDSGGSLTFPRIERGEELYFLMGIVSITNKYDSAVTLFTNITEHIHWINSVLAAIEKNKV